MLTSTRNIVRLILSDGDSVLLAKVIKKGFYFLPGGGVEYNESIRTAATRELSEELGADPLDVTGIQPIGVFEHTWDDNGSPFHEMNFVCQCSIKGLKEGVSVRSSEDHLEFEWVDVSKLDTLDIRPEAFRALIPKWLQPNASNFFASSMS